MRELVQLVEGKRKETWAVAAQMMALMHNMWASKSRGPDDFNPTKVNLPGMKEDVVKATKNIWVKE